MTLKRSVASRPDPHRLWAGASRVAVASVLAGVMAGLAALAGCGQKGPLSLPKASPAAGATTPAPSSSAPASGNNAPSVTR